MKRIVDLAQKLDKSSYKEQAEQIIDFVNYFEKEECLETQQQAVDLIEQIAVILEEALKQQQGYFNYYMSSYFKGSQNYMENQQQITSNLKQMCSIIYQSTCPSQYNQNQKAILISEYFSLHHQFHQNDHTVLKFKEIFAFNSPHTLDFHTRYLKAIIQQQGNSQKIFWYEFKTVFITYLKDILDQKNKTEYNFNDLVTYLKPFIDVNEDNAVDLKEIDQFFSKYFNNPNENKITIDGLYKIIENTMYKPLSYNSLQLQIIQYPEKYSDFYKKNDAKYEIKLYQDKIIFGRKTEIVLNYQPIFCAEDSTISRTQFQVIKDDMQNYYLENLNSNLAMSIKITDTRFNVRKGFQFILTKKATVTVEDITPQHEVFVNGRNSLHPQLDFPFMELKANLKHLSKEPIEKKEKAYQIQFKYNNIMYLCQTQRFTIGKSLSDDIQIENAEDTQLVFEYITNYGWVVYEPKPTKRGSFFRTNFSRQSQNQNQSEHIADQDNQLNASLKKHHINPKFQIFDGITFKLSEYQCQFTFLK